MAEAPPLQNRLKRWFPPIFFALVALGTVPVVLSNLFLSTAALQDSFAAVAGREYATEQVSAFARNPLLIHAHALVGLTLVLVVPFQFWRGFRTRHRRAHRIMGYLSIACLVSLAVSGLAVAIVYPFAGVAGMIPNAVWMSAIVFATAKALRRIRARDMWGHENWMTRAVAMTLGITFATIYLPILTGILGLAPRTALAVSFWLGVTECLGVAELWLRRPGRPGRPLARRPTGAPLARSAA